MRFNLFWNYGGYMRDIPQRLGYNEALDAAVEAMTSAHLDICAGGAIITHRTLSLYTEALGALRVCLDNVDKARSPETLCAVMLLLNCQVR